MKPVDLDAKGRQLLELLAEGCSTRTIAKKMRYSEGTVRVYLHNVYRAIGVRNRTEAVLWYLNRNRTAAPAPAALPAPAPMVPSMAAPQPGESFGDMALREGLFTALGIMESFLGPYGRIWEVGAKLKGSPADEKGLAQRAQARLLWRAMLQGDFGYAKLLYDEGSAERLIYDAPADAVLVASLLLVGGYTTAAERLSAPLLRKRRDGREVSPREVTLLRALREALEGGSDAALGSLYQLAAENASAPGIRQIAMVALFHAYKARKDVDRARATAEAIWMEAEAARRQLEAMGVRPFPRDAAVPAPTGKVARQSGAAREKVAVTR